MTQIVNMVVLSPADNVGIATRDIACGARARELGGRELRTRENIPQGHKVALTDIAHDEVVIRFAMPVAKTTASIPAGSLVHVHNVTSQYLNNDEDHFE
ncbi:MAG: UxaA family hydrolase [Gammaproteobacteria bacterium]